MSRKISLGTKKKSFNSIMEAAKVVAAQTGEPIERCYIRLWKRLNSGKSARQAITKAPRPYMKKQTINEQVSSL